MLISSNIMHGMKVNHCLHILENVKLQNDINLTDARFPVQYVIRPQTDELHDYRGYAGKIISGIYQKAIRLAVQPSGLKAEYQSY